MTQLPRANHVRELTFDDHHLLVNEIFGPTIQGEGKNIGSPCFFLRLAHCNLSCVWCDTPYTWDWGRYAMLDEIHKMTIFEVRNVLFRLAEDYPRFPRLVISGGEPLLQQYAVNTLINQLHAGYWQVEIETAGTIAPAPNDPHILIGRDDFGADQYNVSPKLANSQNTLTRRYKPDVLEIFQATGKAIFKFVISNEADLAEADNIVERCNLREVYVMPEGTDTETLQQRLQWLVPLAIARGYKVTPRLHVDIWGKQRGI